MSKPKCIIIDLEGTLTDCSHRIHHYHNKDYDKWNAGFMEDTVNQQMVNTIKSYRMEGFKIFICTAKESKYSQNVVDWLKSFNIFELFDGIYYRDTGDKRSSMLVKDIMVRDIRTDYEIYHAYDDREEICQRYSLLGIPNSKVSTGKTTIQIKDCKIVEDKSTAFNILIKNANTYKKKNDEYGNSYKDFGKMMVALFPNGLELKTEKDFTRFALLNWKCAKLHRYCKNFGEGHEDSLKDLSIYSAMLQEVDNGI